MSRIREHAEKLCQLKIHGFTRVTPHWDGYYSTLFNKECDYYVCGGNNIVVEVSDDHWSAFVLPTLLKTPAKRWSDFIIATGSIHRVVDSERTLKRINVPTRDVGSLVMFLCALVDAPHDSCWSYYSYCYHVIETTVSTAFSAGDYRTIGLLPHVISKDKRMVGLSSHYGRVTFCDDRHDEIRPLNAASISHVSFPEAHHVLTSKEKELLSKAENCWVDNQDSVNIAVEDGSSFFSVLDAVSMVTGLRIVGADALWSVEPEHVIVSEPSSADMIFEDTSTVHNYRSFIDDVEMITR